MRYACLVSIAPERPSQKIKAIYGRSLSIESIPRGAALVTIEAVLHIRHDEGRCEQALCGFRRQPISTQKRRSIECKHQERAAGSREPRDVLRVTRLPICVEAVKAADVDHKVERFTQEVQLGYIADPKVDRYVCLTRLRAPAQSLSTRNPHRPHHNRTARDRSKSCRCRSRDRARDPRCGDPSSTFRLRAALGRCPNRAA